ncbi:M48 family metallopeptidase [Acidiphilium sp. AL]|uniref:M48 family metallopeptidase n=1 Tax=Acidiphilium sp. AL TaxID=2871704 RepID=UPI0021CAFC31|nr:SprT family zinc-dependent metalloprotease [Acidiphilium sp. AL]
MALALAPAANSMSPNFDLHEESVIIGGRAASVRWRRSQRARRVALKIDPQGGEIVITLPPRGSRRAGLALLRGHEDWVAAKLAALPAPMRLADGEMIPVCGTPRTIIHDPVMRGGTVIAASIIRVTGQKEFLARRVRDALREFAHERFSQRAHETAAKIGVRPRRVRVKDTTSRWGSCAPDGTLMFSWRLIMAPDFVQDYVIAHEVAHLRYLNHGSAFWDLTNRLTPYRAAATSWLSTHGPGLLRIS